MSDKEPKIDITQFNKFAFWLDHHELSTKAIAMYHALLSCLNGNYWNQPIKVSNTVLMHRTGIKHKTTLFEARNELVKNNLISYTAKVGRGEPEYFLLELEKVDEENKINGTENVPLKGSNSTDNVPFSTNKKINGTENVPLKGTENVPLKGSNSTDNVPFSTNKKINGTENVPLKGTENVPLKGSNSTDNVPFTQSIPIYNKHINNKKHTAANIDNTKLVSIAIAEETATSSNNPVEFNTILTVEKILGVTCSQYQAEKYIALCEDVGQVYFVRALEKAAKANAKNFNYVKKTAEGLKTGVDFDDKPKVKTMQERKEELEAWAKANGYEP